MIKKIIPLSFFLLCSQIFAQSLPVGRYSDAALSNGYKSGVAFSFSGEVPIDGGAPITIMLRSEAKPGVLTRFRGKNFLKVVQTSTLTLGQDETTFQDISYIDPVSLNEVYTVNSDGDETGSLEYNQEHPERMQVGDTIAFKTETRVSDKDPATVISYTDSSLSLMPLEGKKGLFEFCNNNAIYKAEDDFKAIQESYNFCMILDKDGNKMGAFLDITAGGINARLSGNIERK